MAMRSVMGGGGRQQERPGAGRPVPSRPATDGDVHRPRQRAGEGWGRSRQKRQAGIVALRHRGRCRNASHGAGAVVPYKAAQAAGRGGGLALRIYDIMLPCHGIYLGRMDELRLINPGGVGRFACGQDPVGGILYLPC